MSLRYFTQPVQVFIVATWNGSNFSECQEALAGFNSSSLVDNGDGTLTLTANLNRIIQTGESFDAQGTIYTADYMSYLQELGAGPGYDYMITESGAAHTMAK